MNKKLMKISSAEFGTWKDRPFLIGLILSFTSKAEGVGCGGIYTVNISKECKWENAIREVTVTKKIEDIYKLLNEAKVNYVSELVGKPVEVTLNGNMFESFRILTEVI